MRVLLKNILSDDGIIKVSSDNGFHWDSYTIAEYRENGIIIPDNTPLENIKIKMVISNMKDIKNDNSFGIDNTIGDGFFENVVSLNIPEGIKRIGDNIMGPDTYYGNNAEISR